MSLSIKINIDQFSSTIKGTWPFYYSVKEETYTNTDIQGNNTSTSTTMSIQTVEKTKVLGFTISQSIPSTRELKKRNSLCSIM